MLRDGIIEPCKSPWASPVCLIQKKDQSYRFCVDYRKLNAVTRKDSYPLPYISSILDKLRDAKYLSSLDIKSAYWQIPIAEDSKDYTAFSVPNGLYRFNVMAFGLTNAPATWQRLIDSILGADLQPSVLVYLDDIIVVSKDFQSHLDTLKEVFQRLRDDGLTINFEKSHFCKPQLKYLGYVVDQLGLRPDPEKVQAILNVQTPKNIREIRRFVGTASWYRRFVPQFSTIIAPLTNLTRKRTPWNWTPECDRAFQQLKECLVSAPLLVCPDFKRTFYVQTDASAYGLGAVLTQQFDDGEKVICYLSRSLTAAERKHSATERECLAVIWAIENLRPYLEGYHFKVITDCHSLLWLHNLKDPHGRLARWSLRLQPYDFEIILRKGSENAVPDFLSRSVTIAVDAVEVNKVNPSVDHWHTKMLQEVQKFPDRYPLWRVENEKLYKFIKPRYSDLSTELEWKLVPPRSQRAEIIKLCHDDPTCGHTGISKTIARVMQKYLWPKLPCDVARYVRHCKICLSIKPDNRPAAGQLLSKIPTATRPWQIICADLMGPLPRSTRGNCYILAVCDVFSKAPLLFPLRTATAAKIARIIEEYVILIFGAPKTIIVDNGVQFRSHMFKNMAKNYNSEIAYTAYYHPQTNPTERVNRTIKTMLTAYVNDNHRTWDHFLAQIGFAIRSSEHEVTKLTPNFVNFGRELSLKGNEEHFEPSNAETPIINIEKRKLAFAQVYRDVKERIRKAHVRSAQRYNLRRRPEKLVLGQRVWRKNPLLFDATKYFSAKLAPKFMGPFEITDIVSPWTYELTDNNGRTSIWNIKDLKAHPPE